MLLLLTKTTNTNKILCVSKINLKYSERYQSTFLTSDAALK